MNVRFYRPGDEEGIVDCWCRALVRDPVSMSVFERKVLLDPNFDPQGTFVAVDGKVLGYAQCLVRRYPYLYDGWEEEKGWITVLASSDSSIYGRLLVESMNYFKRMGRREVWFSCYTPNYFWPGVDREAYPEIYNALKEAGFAEVYDALAMDADLWPSIHHPEGLEVLEDRLRTEGFDIHELHTREIVPLLDFVRRNFSSDWYRHLVELLSRGVPRDQVIVATYGDEVVGYAQFWGVEDYAWACAGEHFGPFGVKQSLRNKGIGTLILYRCLQNMRKRGVHRAFLLWTDPQAARLYERFGFRVTRKFTVMKKVL